MALPYNCGLIGHARSLRRGMTRQERHLWYDFLRRYPIKFYRQRIIGSYIADFYAASVQLVIELDGSQHYNPEAMEYDDERTRFLQALGIVVLRYTNKEVDDHFSMVCAAIDSAAQRKLRDELD